MNVVMPWELLCRNCYVDFANKPGEYCEGCAKSDEARLDRALKELPLNDPYIEPELAQQVLDRCSHMLSPEFKALYERKVRESKL